MSTLAEFSDSTEPDRPADCGCTGRTEVAGVKLIPCFPCFCAGFETPNENPPEEDE